MDQRISSRTPYLRQTEITWHDGTRQVTMSGLIEDRSSFGLGIKLAESILEGSHIRVKYQGRTMAGIVRYCVQQRHGALIGFSFEREQSDGLEPRWKSAEQMVEAWL